MWKKSPQTIYLLKLYGRTQIIYSIGMMTEDSLLLCFPLLACRGCLIIPYEGSSSDGWQNVNYLNCTMLVTMLT